MIDKNIIEESQQKMREDFEIGVDAEVFFSSKLGQKICETAAHDLEEARNKLETIDPANTEEVRKYQNRCYLARESVKYIANIINTGKEAERQLRDFDTISEE